MENNLDHQDFEVAQRDDANHCCLCNSLLKSKWVEIPAEDEKCTEHAYLAYSCSNFMCTMYGREQ